MKYLIFAVFIGSGATMLVDIWSIARKYLFGVPLPNYGFVGRWFAHMVHGQFRHDSIGKAPPVRGELIFGWVAHYLIGIAFAGMLLALCGISWVQNPTIIPALLLGIGTVAAPFLLMQPGMGMGIAASRSAKPNSARVQSLITHLMFGLGLFATAWVMSFLLK